MISSPGVFPVIIEYLSASVKQVSNQFCDRYLVKVNCYICYFYYGVNVKVFRNNTYLKISMYINMMQSKHYFIIAECFLIIWF